MIKILRKYFPKKLLNGLVKSSINSVFLNVGHLILGFLSSLLLARFLGPDEYGIYAFLIALISVFSIPTQLGIPKLLIRYISKYQATQEWAKIKGILKWSNLIVFSVSFLLVITIWISIYFKFIEFENHEYISYLIASILIPVLSLGALRGGALRGLNFVIRGLLPEKILTKGLLVLFISVIYFLFKVELNTVHAISLNLSAALISFFIGSWWLWKYTPNIVFKSIPEYEYKTWFKVSVPFMLIGGVSIINNQLDILLLNWLSTSNEVGIYSVTYKLAGLIPFILVAVNLVFEPKISSLFTLNNKDEIQRIITVGVLVAAIFALPISFLFAIFGESILGFLFGHEYQKGRLTLVFLVIGQLINVLSGSVGVLLNMTGNHKLVLYGMLIAAIFNIILNIILIPKFGMEGAAVATLFTYLNWNAFLVIMSIKYLGINPSILSYFKKFDL